MNLTLQCTMQVKFEVGEHQCFLTGAVNCSIHRVGEESVAVNYLA